MLSTSSVGMTSTTPGPIVYAMIATIGLSVGWVVSRYASGAREPNEFIPTAQAIDRIADTLARRFGDRVLPDNPDEDDLERVTKNALAVSGVMLVSASLIAMGPKNAIAPIGIAGCIVVLLLEMGEVLVAYGVADEPILTTETEQ